MLDVVKQWIMGVTAAAVLVAAAGSLMPRGTVQRIGKLTGALVLMLSVLSPIWKVNGMRLSRALTEYRLPEEDRAVMAGASLEVMKELIEEQSDAYISDKAEDLGIRCTVAVETREQDGYPVPWAVTVRGSLTAEQREALTRRIEADFAIPAQRQTYHMEEVE